MRFPHIRGLLLFNCAGDDISDDDIQKAKSKIGTELISYLSGLLRGSFFTQALNITEAQAKRESGGRAGETEAGEVTKTATYNADNTVRD